MRSDPKVQERMAAVRITRAVEEEERLNILPTINLEGEAALRRLLPLAKKDTGQSGVIARFLLNLYNGKRFPFDMTDLRRIDYQLHDDCIAVLKMDFEFKKEVHMYFENGSAIWEQLAKDWGLIQDE